FLSPLNMNVNVTFPFSFNKHECPFFFPFPFFFPTRPPAGASTSSSVVVISTRSSQRAMSPSDCGPAPPQTPNHGKSFLSGGLVASWRGCVVHTLDSPGRAGQNANNLLLLLRAWDKGFVS